MLMTTSRHLSRCSLFAAFLAVLSAIAVPAAAEEICKDFDKKHQIWRLGGGNAFSDEAAGELADLQRLVEDHWTEIEAMLAERSLPELAEPLREAIRKGAVTERDLARGEILHWMAWRRGKKPTTSGPMCVATAKPYSAWVVEVESVKETPTTIYTTPHTFLIPKVCLNIAYLGAGDVLSAVKAVCRIEAKRSCEADSPKVTVDASGSSPGSVVTMAAGEGLPQTIIAAGSDALTWTGADPDPYLSNLMIKVTGPEGACEAMAELEPCEAPEPWCKIKLPEEVYAREPFEIAVDGHKDIALTVKSSAGDTYEVTSPMTLGRPGSYTVDGLATNEVGETAACSAALEVMPRWTFRPFLASVNPTNEFAKEALVRPTGVFERSSIQLGEALGIGAAAEYHLSKRFGIEGALLYSELDADFMLDLSGSWGQDDSGLGFTALTVGPVVHLTPKIPADIFFGGFVGLLDLGSTTFSALGETHRRDFDEDITYGLHLGADIPFGAENPWGFYAGLRYFDLRSDLEGATTPDLDLNMDPFVLAAGFAYDF